MPTFRTRLPFVFRPALLVSILCLLWPGILAAGPDPRPNLILLMVDDLSAFELSYGFGRSLGDGTTALDTHLVNRGLTLPNFFNTTPLCCPSRVSYLTGQYAHNHTIYGNNYNQTGGFGGWRRFHEAGLEAESIGTWMQGAGYHTALIGKWLNGYPDRPGRFLPEEYVPTGWSEWYGSFTNDDPFSYTAFRVNQNGTVTSYTDGTYLTDLERDLAVDYITRQAGTGQPFFLMLTPYAPHGPNEPAARHLGTHIAAGVTTAVPPSHNEEDLSDKPPHLQENDTFYPTHFNDEGLIKLDMTLALDELIEALFTTLETEGVLDNTYVFFSSDNGLLWGEHRLRGKSLPYEESVRIPMYVRGPGVAEGVTREHLTLNIDLAPTLIDLAQETIPASIDGESLRPVLEDTVTAEHWRDVVGIELLTPNNSTNQPVSVPRYDGVRGRRSCLYEHETKDQEFYDLTLDPFQLESQHATAPPELRALFEGALADLTACSGQSCRDATRRGWPHPAFSIDCTELSCTFDGTLSSDPDGTLASFRWTLGDGTILSGPSVSHTYPAGGFFTVDLTVVDNEGQPASVAQRLLLGEFFVDGFESGDTSAWAETVP